MKTTTKLVHEQQKKLNKERGRTEEGTMRGRSRQQEKEKGEEEAVEREEACRGRKQGQEKAAGGTRCQEVLCQLE